MWASTTTLARSGSWLCSQLVASALKYWMASVEVLVVSTDIWKGGAQRVKRKGSRSGACREYATAAVAPRSFDPRLQQRPNVAVEKHQQAVRCDFLHVDAEREESRSRRLPSEMRSERSPVLSRGGMGGGDGVKSESGRQKRTRGGR
ncbi:hypothetical protein CORC01_08811 [Colletotrichum orchidophilum]|uniref:Uncharacterized protein n=1 Tax=Colletotrichum orchidophilum TaxID=1209926 RepID=A0A1G4B3F8_9PEZI|nr:uncharacterized protein CORC01_08811 [Colletotrichum orchidophilum]OHE95959.1 hypothetical protein CORC01_08811 [Colletotrichum orchidophilum]